MAALKRSDAGSEKAGARVRKQKEPKHLVEFMKAIDDLPFVTSGKASINHWDVRSSGDTPEHYGQDCATGRTYAAAAIDVMRTTEFTPLLGLIVKSMIKRGEFDGIEVGFLQHISERATWLHD